MCAHSKKLPKLVSSMVAENVQRLKYLQHKLDPQNLHKAKCNNMHFQSQNSCGNIRGEDSKICRSSQASWSSIHNEKEQENLYQHGGKDQYPRLSFDSLTHTWTYIHTQRQTHRCTYHVPRHAHIHKGMHAHILQN